MPSEVHYDKKLKISTTERDDYHADEYRYPYEPTPYKVLERLAESKYIDRDSYVVDYGCGKGRVGFYLHDVIGCYVTGIEYDERIYAQALENLKTHPVKGGVEFICTDAVDYQVTGADCFYFFNPFSVEILRGVLGKIIESYYDEPREMKLFFYYPSDEYLACLMTAYELAFLDEIDCSDLFSGNNKRERILIFTLGYV